MTLDSRKIFPLPLRSFDAASLTANYLAVGAELQTIGRVAKFYNLSNVEFTLSWDGVDPHEVFAPGASLTLDVTANHSRTNEGLFIAKNTQFFVKGSAAGVGFFYISIYGEPF